MADLEIRLLRREDDRGALACGEPALDRFFQHYAGKNQYAKLPDVPIPGLRLARLGVDRRAQGLGIGKALVRHVLHLALAQRDPVGCVGVVTDAKPDAVAFYDGLGFSRLEGVREGMLHGDPTPMFLDIATIAAAVDAVR